MRILFIAVVFSFFLPVVFSGVVIAQTNKVVITSKTVIYRRKNYEKDDLKAKFTIIEPQIKVPGNVAVERKIRQKLDYKKVFNISTKEDGDDYLDITSLYFKTIYNDAGFWDTQLFYETLGAYPWTNRVELIFNLKNGVIVSAADCFKSSAMRALAKRVRRKILAEIAQAKIKYGGFPPESEEGEYNLSNLDNFSINRRGIAFHYDYGFNFASRSLQPKGDFFFTYAQLKPFIKSNGLLAKFIR